MNDMVRRVQRSLRNGKEREAATVTQTAPRSLMAEAYRTLRTNLNFAVLDREVRVIAVTSPAPHDGKTATAVNLAVVLAQAGHRTLLVDADMRRPYVHRVFQVDNSCGITNALVQGRDPLEFLRPGPVDNLSLLFCGPLPPNPAELLASERVTGLWPRLREQFDYVVVDSPPVLAVADAMMIGSQADGVLLVLSAGETRIEAAREAKERLVHANAHILGVVLNRVRMSAQEYPYYYYYYTPGDGEGQGVRL